MLDELQNHWLFIHSSKHHCAHRTLKPSLQTNAERIKIEDQLAEVELQHKGLQDLIATLQDSKGAQKVVEWHSKMETLRLEEMRQKREIDRLKQQLKFKDSQIKKHEAEVQELDEQTVRQTKVGWPNMVNNHCHAVFADL